MDISFSLFLTEVMPAQYLNSNADRVLLKICVSLKIKLSNTLVLKNRYQRIALLIKRQK